MLFQFAEPGNDGTEIEGPRATTDGAGNTNARQSGPEALILIAGLFCLSEMPSAWNSLQTETIESLLTGCPSPHNAPHSKKGEFIHRLLWKCNLIPK